MKYIEKETPSEEASSLPSRERGLKLRLLKRLKQKNIVAPFAGARIEIAALICGKELTMSLPSRERGLKLIQVFGKHIRMRGRSLRGSAD